MNGCAIGKYVALDIYALVFVAIGMNLKARGAGGGGRAGSTRGAGKAGSDGRVGSGESRRRKESTDEELVKHCKWGDGKQSSFGGFY